MRAAALCLLLLLGTSCAAPQAPAPDPELPPAPKSPDAYSPAELLAVGKAYNQNGESEKAISVLKKCLAKEPGLAEAHFQLGFALTRLGQRGEAKAALEQAHRLDPANAQAALMLGMTYDLMKQPEKALAVYDAALGRNPAHAGLHHEKGNTLLLLDRRAEAVQSLERARELTPADPDLLGDLGYALLLGGKAEPARRVLQEAHDRAPDRADIAMNLGRACLAVGDAAVASEAFLALTRLKAKDAEGHILLALSRFREKKLKAALTAARRAIELAPARPKAHFLLGVVLDALGDKKAARKSIKKTLTLDPDFAAARDWLKKHGR